VNDGSASRAPRILNQPQSFRHVEKFRFADQRAFDFRGETERNLHQREGTLANSNQRALKGFEPTFALKRDFGGLVGRYKLDWLFVKPFIPRPRGEGMSYEFAHWCPKQHRTMAGCIEDRGFESGEMGIGD
jgi:hypothetical protein